ncbi:MAG: hypothetical protein GTN40_05640 [Candidatus Aenigmarchaeota archaeon]|nr:hypothetical protein [Candidatus Aenigmarchaeota archaeon]
MKIREYLFTGRDLLIRQKILAGIKDPKIRGGVAKEMQGSSGAYIELELGKMFDDLRSPEAKEALKLALGGYLLQFTRLMLALYSFELAAVWGGNGKTAASGFDVVDDALALIKEEAERVHARLPSQFCD